MVAQTNPGATLRPAVPNRRRGELWPLAGVLLAAFALRLWLLGEQNVWWDEGLAIWAVRQGWARMTLWTATDVHPPLYFWLLKAWVSLAGESEFSARFISLICGVVTVAALYPLAKALLGRRVALLATSLLAFSRFHIWWSQEMRMYIVATLWGVLSLYTLLRWCTAEGWWPAETGARPQRPAGQALLYVLTTAAGLYTLYLFVTVVLIENLFVVYLLLRRKALTRGGVANGRTGSPAYDGGRAHTRGRAPDCRTDSSAYDGRRALIRWGVAQVAVLALFAPWLAVALPRMRSWSVAEPFSLRVFVELYATLLTLGISTYVERYLALVAPFFVLVCAAVGAVWWSRRRPVHGTPKARAIALLLALFLVVPTLVVYVLTRPRGLFYSPRVEARYLVLFAPAFYLLLAWSLALLYRRVRWVGLAALLFVAAVFAWVLPGHYAGRYLRDVQQTMVRSIAAYAQPGDAVVLVSGDRYPLFGYYYERLPGGSPRPPVYLVPQYTLQVGQDSVERELAALAGTHTRLWLAQVNASLQDPQGLVQSWLDERLSRAWSQGFGYDLLTLYAPPGEAVTMQPGNLRPQFDLSGTLGTGARILGYDLPTREFRAGDVVRPALYYAAQLETQATVRMVNAQGQVLEEQQVTLAPAEPVGRQQLEFAVYSRTPSGVYHFEIPEPQQPGQAVAFGTLHVARTQPLPKAGKPALAAPGHLEDGIELLGYTLTDARGKPVTVIRSGQTLNLDLYWVARQKPAANYTVFAHLVGAAYNPATAGPVWAGHDSEPLERGYPTQQWFVNQVVIDRHVLNVDGGAPAGEYELEAGMYVLQTMKRLQVTDGQGQTADRIVLGHFEVIRP